MGTTPSSFHARTVCTCAGEKPHTTGTIVFAEPCGTAFLRARAVSSSSPSVSYSLPPSLSGSVSRVSPAATRNTCLCRSTLIGSPFCSEP